MGHMTALAIAESNLSLREQLSHHLSFNHYPSIPASMIETCIEAIEKADNGLWNEEVALPQGTLYRDSSTAPVWAIVEAHHLHAWLTED